MQVVPRGRVWRQHQRSALLHRPAVKAPHCRTWHTRLTRASAGKEKSDSAESGVAEADVVDDEEFLAGEDESDEEEQYDDEEDDYEYFPVVTTPLLSVEQVADALYDNVHEHAAFFYKAFYSSVLGGITTEPVFMTVPIDDHMVHRGHAVFDTAIVVEGQMYQLQQHIDRLVRSAEKARIPLPETREQLARIVLDTAAASRSLNGFLRFWLSAGRGGFTLSGNDCIGSEFYCIYYNGPYEELDETKGWRVKTSPILNKPGVFAELKSTNYLQNALNVMDAQDGGLDQGIFVHPDGTLCEGPNLNIGVITVEGKVLVPPFVECLAGCTMTRIMELIPDFVERELLEGISGFQQAPITIADVATASEVFMTGGSVPVAPVVQWDGRKVGDGTVGVGVLALRQMILEDMKPRPDSDQHTVVPYGMLTGMPEDS